MQTAPVANKPSGQNHTHTVISLVISLADANFNAPDIHLNPA